jgi:hypothetical protein
MGLNDACSSLRKNCAISSYNMDIKYMRECCSLVQEIRLGDLICSRKLENAANFILNDDAEIIIRWNLFVLGIDLQLFQVFFWLPDIYFAAVDE